MVTYRISLTGLIMNDGTTPPVAGSSKTNLEKTHVFYKNNRFTYLNYFIWQNKFMLAL